MPNRKVGKNQKGKTGFLPTAPEHQLGEPEYHQICRWLGEFIHPGRIPELVQQTFGKTIDQSYPYQFQTRHKWALVIDRYRQEYLTKVAEVPLFHKKYRLQKLQTLVDSLDRQHTDASLPAKQYETRLLSVLREARQEMEEKSDNHQWFFTNITTSTDAELVARREQLLKRIQAFSLPNRRRPDAEGLGHEREAVEATVVSGGPGDGGSDPQRDGDDDRAMVGQVANG